MLENLEWILAIELLSACQAIEFRRPLKSSAILEKAHELVRRKVSFASEDRIFADDINQMKELVADFSFVNGVNEFANSKGVELNQGFDPF